MLVYTTSQLLSMRIYTFVFREQIVSLQCKQRFKEKLQSEKLGETRLFCYVVLPINYDSVKKFSLSKQEIQKNFKSTFYRLCTLF